MIAIDGHERTELEENSMSIASLRTQSVTNTAIAKLPVLGWTSQYFGENIDDNLIRTQAQALVDSKMAAAGYRYVIIDNGWCGGTDTDGIITPDLNKFADFPGLVNDLKKMGLKVGLYVTAGSNHGGIGGVDLLKNCERICNEWGIDLLSISEVNDAQTGREIHSAIRSISEEVIIDIRSNGFPGPWIAEIANQWNLYDSLEPKFFDLSRDKLDNIVGTGKKDADAALSITRERAKYSGLEHYYNVGNIPVGQGMNENQDLAIFSEYCILGCPIITGIDLTTMSIETRDIFINEEALAIHQDAMGSPGICARYYDPWHCLYKRDLSDGSTAFLLFNRCHHGSTFTLEYDVDLTISAETPYHIYDVWSHS